MELTNPATGHQVRTDEASVGFWKAAGYRAPAVESEKPKAAPRKRSAKKSDN